MIEPKHMECMRDRLIADRGDLTLFALFQPEEANRAWDLVIAGGGLRPGDLDDYRYIAEVMEQCLTLSERLQLRMFTVISEDYDQVDRLLRKVNVNRGEPVELENFNFYQFLIRNAVIFHAHRSEPEPAHQS
jgi:hypothetical protein